MSKIIGIDLGTGNSCVSVFEGGQPVVIANSEGKRTTPSVVGFTDNGERRVGDPAKRQAITNPKTTLYSVKRIIGRSYDESKDEKVTYSIVNKDGKACVEVGDRIYTPQEISAIVLQKMKKTAEEYLGEEVKDAVITVPARFSQDQRQATKEAGEIAGLNVRRIINEPTAAAIAYGIDKLGKDCKIAVFDSGCGTYDISILELGGGVFEVLSTDGNDHLGGDDFDQVIIDWIVEEFKKDENSDLTKDLMAMQRLKEAAEKAKIELSTSMDTEINLPYITAVDGAPKHIVKKLTRAKFEQLSDKVVKMHKEPCLRALKSADLKPSDIDEVILVGGTTRIPAIQALVKEIFNKEPNKSVNPDEAVAIGASIQGAILNQEDGVEDIVLLDVAPLNIGIETVGGLFTTLIEANTTIPCERKQIFSTAADNQTAVTIRIAQGNRPMFNDNKVLGQFNLDNIPPARKGVPQIEVSINVDANSIVTVTAKDLGTNKEQHITIQNNNLSKDEIERMKAEAEKYAKDDKKRAEEVQKINTADSYVFGVEKSLDELKDVITEEDKDKLKKPIEDVKKAVEDKNVEECERTRKALEEIYNPIIQKAYASKAPSGGTFNFEDIINEAKTAQPTGQTQANTEYADVQDAEEV